MLIGPGAGVGHKGFPVGGETSVVPPQAAAVGYHALTFNGNFTGASVDSANTKASRFDFYPWDFFSSLTNLSAITLNADGSVTLAGDTTGPNGELATATDTGGGTFKGTAFGGGAYFEATLKFNPADTVAKAFVGWPSFWSMALEHLVGLAGDHWPGQAAGYKHFAEVDFFEFNESGFVPALGTGFGSSGYHDWYETSSEQFQPPTTQILNYLGSWDLTQYHKYGCLWVPATASTRGYIAFYFDDTQVGAAFSWKQYDPSKAPPVNTAVFASTHSSYELGLQGNAVRQVLAPALLSAGDGGNVYVTFAAGGTFGTLKSAWIGESGGVNEYDFDGNQVQLTFNNGQPSLAFYGGDTFTTDPVAFTFDPAKKLVISMYFEAETPTTDLQMDQQTGLTGATLYSAVTMHTSTGNPQADTSGNTSVTMGASESGVCLGVRSVDLMDYTLLSILDAQHLVPILGTGVGEPMTVQTVKVWQASAGNNLIA